MSQTKSLPFLAAEELDHEALPLPEFEDPRFAYYAVRLEDDEGYWPARLIEGRSTPLCNPEASQKRIYPPYDPNSRHPRTKYENPGFNVIVSARDKDGEIRPMYLSDAVSLGLAHTGQIDAARRCWERVDESDIRFFEDPKAAAMTTWKPVVEVVGWCPLTQDDDHGYPAQHGDITPKGEKIPGTGKVSNGLCAKCGDNTDRRRDALKKIRSLLKVGV